MTNSSGTTKSLGAILDDVAGPKGTSPRNGANNLDSRKAGPEGTGSRDGARNEILIDKTGQAEVITASDGSLTVTVPIRIKRRGSRKAVTLPDGEAMQPRPWDHTPTPIQLALARGHRWLAMVESGEARTLSEVAEREGMDRAYVSRMVNLTTLAPDIVAAILDETLPPEVTLFDLASGTPLLWEEQRERIGS